MPCAVQEVYTYQKGLGKSSFSVTLIRPRPVVCIAPAVLVFNLPECRTQRDPAQVNLIVLKRLSVHDLHHTTSRTELSVIKICPQLKSPGSHPVETLLRNTPPYTALPVMHIPTPDNMLPPYELLSDALKFFAPRTETFNLPKRMLTESTGNQCRRCHHPMNEHPHG